jgi:regulatory protein
MDLSIAPVATTRILDDMKITRIAQQQKQVGRYSIYIDGVYAFSLSEAALLTSKLTPGQELDDKQLGELKLRSTNDKLFNQVCRYAALRSRTTWEVSQYLKRKQAAPALVDELLNKLSNVGLINDEQYVRAYIHDRQLLRPTSRRKLIFELRKKHVADKIIEQALGDDSTDQTALKALIARKREQSRYQDDLKLMQYLSRQGFHYGDIKDAMGGDDL